MATYTTPFSITSQFGFCGLPLRLDTYRGCAFQCSYCFARYRGGNSPSANVQTADPAQIVRILDRSLVRCGTGVIAEFLRRRTPIHLGGMSDPLQPAEIRYGTTAQTLRQLVRHRYPTVLSTRSTLSASSPYLELLKDLGYVVVQFSFCSSRDEVAERTEPHSTRPSQLLRTMETLSKEGVHVTCRWQPYVPGVSEAPQEFVARIAQTGCCHVGFEHLKIPVERGNPLWKAFVNDVKRDLFQEYKILNAVRDGREMVLPASEKVHTVLEVRDEVHRHGMTFGAADNEFQFLSDTSCCCSGVDQFRGFENWFRHQIGFAVRQSKGTAIEYRSIEEEWAPSGSIDRYLNSRSRLSQRTDAVGTVREHIRARWNNPRGAGSPATFYGVQPRDSKIQRASDVIYHWNEDGRQLISALY